LQGAIDLVPGTIGLANAHRQWAVGEAGWCTWDDGQQVVITTRSATTRLPFCAEVAALVAHQPVSIVVTVSKGAGVAVLVDCTRDAVFANHGSEVDAF